MDYLLTCYVCLYDYIVTLQLDTPTKPTIPTHDYLM